MPAHKKKTFYTEENMPVFHHLIHRHLWNFLSFHPGWNKSKAIEEMRNLKLMNDEEYRILTSDPNLCVACIYANQARDIHPEKNVCDLCPLSFKNAGLCLGGKYFEWERLSVLSLTLQEAYNRVEKGDRNLDDLKVFDETDEHKSEEDEDTPISVNDYVKKYIRKGYNFESALQDRLTKARVQCMIAASTICCMPVKTGVKTDDVETYYD